MMRNAVLIIVAWVCLSATAWCEVVYTVSGDTYEGIVSRQEGKVIVQTDKGMVVLEASQVIYIARSAAGAPQSQPATASRPAPAEATTKPATDPAERPADLSVRSVPLGQMTRPEPIIYMYMRSLAITLPGKESVYFRKQIELWRAHAHDRRRKAGLEWLEQRDFVRHRERFDELLREAEELARKAGPSYGRKKTSKKPTAEEQRYHRASIERMRQAARTWADPLLRNFLAGVSELHGGDYRKAEELFARCTQFAPRVAGFHQGLGVARTKQDRHIKALEAFLNALHLRPDSAEAAYQVQEAMKRVPGGEIKSGVYRRARKIMKHYPRQSQRRPGAGGRVVWLMPAIRARGGAADTLPMLPYDRLTFRQGVATPVGKNTLLVDREVVERALELFVRVDDQTVAPAVAGRTRSHRGKIHPPPVMMITVPGYEFKPTAALANASIAPGRACAAYAIATYEQMGSEVRTIGGHVQAAGKGPAGSVSMQLLPGESAAPVLTEDGTLVGFLASRTDVRIDGAGPNKFIVLGDLADILKRAAKSRRPSPYPSGYSRAQRKITPQTASGQTFIVYATFGERLD